MRFIGREGAGVCGREWRFALMPCHAGGGIDGSLLAIHYTLEAVLR
jgi:hypothetical protein